MSKKNVESPAVENEIQIADIATELENQIQKLKHKNDLILFRQKFLDKKNDIETCINNQGSDFDDFEEDAGYYLTFHYKLGYKESVFSVRNNLLVRQIAQLLIITINDKVKDIEEQIKS